MILAIGITLILTAVLFSLAFPFWRREDVQFHLGPDAHEDQRQLDLGIERRRLLQSLSDLEAEMDRGEITPEDYQRSKSREERRLIGVLEALDQGEHPDQHPAPASSDQTRLAGSWIFPIVLGVLVVGSATGIYAYLNDRYEQKVAGMERAAQASSNQPDPREMVARLEARLLENPDDLEGQIMAGRSYMALGRLEDASAAWLKVLELDSRNHEAHYHLGLILLQTLEENTPPEVLEMALRHFDTALINVPREPAILWYRGMALVHMKRFREADEAWTSAYQNLLPGTEDAEFVKKALQSLREGTPLDF